MEPTSDGQTIQHRVPDDQALLAALGRVSIEHAFLDLVLKRTVKVLAGLTVEEADMALGYEGSASLRDLIKRLSAAKLGKASPEHLKLRALLAECDAVTEQRNGLIHRNWVGVDGNKEIFLLRHDGMVQFQPRAEYVLELADKIRSIAERLNAARLGTGFIAAALASREGSKVVATAKADRE